MSYFLITWGIGQLIHPVLYIMWCKTGADDVAIGTAFEVLVMGAAFSIPALLLCFILFQPVKKLRLRAAIRFAIWAVIVVASISFTMLILVMLTGGAELFFQLYDMLIPGCIAALISVLLRYKQFLQLVNSQNSYYEND